MNQINIRLKYERAPKSHEMLVFVFQEHAKQLVLWLGLPPPAWENKEFMPGATGWSKYGQESGGRLNPQKPTV